MSFPQEALQGRGRDDRLPRPRPSISIDPADPTDSGGDDREYPTTPTTFMVLPSPKKLPRSTAFEYVRSSWGDAFSETYDCAKISHRLPFAYTTLIFHDSEDCGKLIMWHIYGNSERTVHNQVTLQAEEEVDWCPHETLPSEWKADRIGSYFDRLSSELFCKTLAGALKLPKWVGLQDADSSPDHSPTSAKHPTASIAGSQGDTGPSSVAEARRAHRRAWWIAKDRTLLRRFSPSLYDFSDLKPGDAANEDREMVAQKHESCSIGRPFWNPSAIIQERRRRAEEAGSSSSAGGSPESNAGMFLPTGAHYVPQNNSNTSWTPQQLGRARSTHFDSDVPHLESAAPTEPPSLDQSLASLPPPNWEFPDAGGLVLSPLMAHPVHVRVRGLDLRIIGLDTESEGTAGEH